MAYTLDFDLLHTYDPGKAGITIPVVLKLGSKAVEVEAKLDTGAAYCIFARAFGEDLGFDIESGSSLHIATPTGSFLAYGHTVTLSLLDYDFDSLVYFAADESFYRNVLGRYGCLNQIQLGIVDYEGKLFLNRYITE
jgi:hypothetical protein